MLLAAAAAAAMAATAAQVSPLTVAEEQAIVDYGQLPSFDQVTLSPDGSRVAYIGTLANARHMLVKDLVTGRKLVDFSEAPRQKLRGVEWADDDHVLTTVSMTTTVLLDWQGDWGEYFGVLAADLKTGKAWDVLEFPGGIANNARRIGVAGGRLRARKLDGETWVYVTGFFTSGAQFEARGTMMKINLVKGTHRLIENRDYDKQYDELMDAGGNVVAVSYYDNRRRRWQLEVGTDGHLQQALSGAAEIDAPTFVGISPDGKNVWLKTWSDGISTPTSLSLATGKPVEADSSDPDARRAAWKGELLDRRNDRVVAGVVKETLGFAYEFLDPQLKDQWQRVKQAVGGMRPRLVSNSDDYSRVVVLVQAPTGPQFLLIDMATTHIVPLGPQYRQLPAVAEVREIEYPAADGLTIPAYLTLPAGRSAKALPLVVLPHGGPESRDSGGFDWWAQALANEGYAVLQPNFRGSTVSDEFVVAGHGQWGRRMQTDLSDGVQYLASKGLIDPARVCIVGASYGGYAALAGITLQQGIYRCAVSVAGVSDLHRQITPHAEVRSSHNIEVRYWERWLGVSDLSDASVDERSPLRHVDAISVPLLMIHGRDDTVVRYEQSSLMAEALNRLHKPFELVDLKAEDHWLSHSETRVQMLAATLAFLKANNPPDIAAAPTAAANP